MPLMKKGSRFLWSPACQVAFDTLEEHLINPLVLSHPNTNAPFIVYTDASHSLNPAERNYAATELECLAVVWTLEQWRTYLEGRLFTKVTDHASLLWVFNTTKPSTPLIRSALRLQEFPFTVENRKGLCQMPSPEPNQIRHP